MVVRRIVLALAGIMGTVNRLLSSAYAAGAAAPAFNDTFYVAVVTVIPVLFLAIAVQGDLYVDLLGFSAARAYRSLVWSLKRRNWMRPASMAIGFATYVTRLLAVAILFYGVVGEISGLLSLYWRRSLGGSFFNPGWAAVFLTAIAGGGAILALVKSLFVGVFAHNLPAVHTYAYAIIVGERGILTIPEGEPEPGRSRLSFPGGRVMTGESLEATAVRTTFEQTGLTVTPRSVLVGAGRQFNYVACDLVKDAGRPFWVIEWCKETERIGGSPWNESIPVLEYVEAMLATLPGKA